MASVSVNQSKSSSSGTSSSFLPSYPEEGFLAALAAYEQQVQQQQYQWGQQQYAQNTGLTNDIVNNYLKSSQATDSAAQSQLNQYQQLFQPEMQQYTQEANAYASAPRQEAAMGAAEAATSQNFQGQRDAALANLQSFGIDPSSGRYAALDQAENTQQAAASAGAANQARQATENTGLGLQAQAIQMGAALPGEATGLMNVGNSAQAGAENAALSNTNLGSTLLGTPNQYGTLASNLKYPPLGSSSQQQSQSTSQGSSAASDPPAQPKSGGSGGGGNGTQYQPIPTPGPGPAGNNGPSGVPTGGPGGGGGGGGGGNGYQPYQGYKPSAPYPNGPTTGDPGSGGNTPEPYQGYKPSAPYPNGPTTGDPGSGGNYEPSYSPVAGGGGGSYSAAASIFPASAGLGSGGTNTFATGGAIPTSMSPSHGKRTDDIPARLNAGEYVIPKDVVHWKGHEYFQKLIDQSRKARQKGSAKPTTSNAMPTGR